MKKLISLILILATSYSFALPSPAATPLQSLNQIAAVVNNSVITESQLNLAIKQYKERFSKQGVQLPDADTFKTQVLDHLISTKLQTQIAKRAGVTASNKEVNQAIAKIAQQNNLSLPAFFKKVAQTEGLNKQAFKAQIKTQLIVSKTQRAAIMPRVQVSKKAVEKAYTNYLSQGKMASKYHLGDIVIALPSNPTSAQLQQANRKANHVMAQLQKGASFSHLARDYSAGNTALNGGNLGWRKLGEIPQIFAAQVRKMKQGDIAGPIRAPNGLHIIKLEGVKKAQGRVSKQQVRMMLMERQFNEKLQKWLQKMRSTAYIKIMSWVLPSH